MAVHISQPPWLRRRGFVELSDEAIEASRWAARGLAVFALGVFAVLLLERGAPQSMSETEWESTAQYMVLGIVAIGSLIAWKWEGVGGWVLTTGAVALGVLASIMYQPGIALFGCLGFFLPGLLFLVHWQHHHGRLAVAVTAVGMVALLGTGAVASARVYDYFSGPTHPESHLSARPVDIAEWVLAGAVDTQGFEVKARLADPGAGVPELMVSPLEGDMLLYTFAASEGPSPDGDVVTFRATGLSAGTHYRYALALDGREDQNRAGTVRTMPAGPASFTVALASCARTGSNGQVFDRIREAEPLLYIQMGDFHYANIGSDDAGRIRGAYERAIESAAQQTLYLSTALAYTWDDHDFGGNDANSTTASRDAVQQVYREYFPHYDFPGREAGGPIYQAFSAGRVRFILTDTRSEKSPVGATWDAGRSMLGSAQKE